MSEYEQIFHKQEIHDLYTKGEVTPLDDLYGIEGLALVVKDLDKKVEFLKEYKKRKKEDIDKEIKVLENKIEFFKKVVIRTLKDKKEKSVDFPGSCKAISRNQKANWKIIDDEEFIKIIRDAEDQGEKINKAIKEINEYVVRKKEANKLLDIWEKNGNLEKYFDIEKNNKASKVCVSKEPAKTSVSFSYPKEEESDEVIDETIIPVKGVEVEKTDNADFDAL